MPPAPRVGPITPHPTRLLARCVDLAIEAGLLVGLFAVVHLRHRPFTGLAMAGLTVFAYEALTTARWQATLGKRIFGLRVIALDHADPPASGAVARRSAVNAGLFCLPVIGWLWWIVTVGGDPTHRGPADRTAGTMVVPHRAALPVATHDLPGYADAARPPRISARGRVGDLDVRIRGRLRRLVDAPMLAWAVGIMSLAATIPHVTRWVILGSAATWLVLFVIDETRRVHRTAQTAGHRLGGLVIIDLRTGRAPGKGRAFVRALVLAGTIYVPLLWPLLLVSLVGMRFGKNGRGLHDLLARTIVVGDPRLDPETQRQRAMLLRTGRAA